MGFLLGDRRKERAVESEGVQPRTTQAVPDPASNPPGEGAGERKPGDATSSGSLVARRSAELKRFQAKERSLLLQPPKDLTPEQLDKEFAELRWSIATRLGGDDIPGAISYARASLGLDPDHADRWERLGDLCNFSGELTSSKDAAEAYEKALGLDPNRAEAHLKLASADVMIGRPLAALPHLEANLRSLGDRAEPRAIALYAGACLSAEATARGIIFCQERLEDGGNNRYRIICAILEKAVGRTGDAVGLLAQVEQSEGRSSPIAAYAAKLRESYSSSREAGK